MLTEASWAIQVLSGPPSCPGGAPAPPAGREALGDALCALAAGEAFEDPAETGEMPGDAEVPGVWPFSATRLIATAITAAIAVAAIGQRRAPCLLSMGWSRSGQRRGSGRSARGATVGMRDQAGTPAAGVVTPAIPPAWAATAWPVPATSVSAWRSCGPTA